MTKEKKRFTSEEKNRLTAYADSIKFIGGFQTYRVDLDVSQKDDPDSRAIVIADDDDKVVLIRLYKNFFSLADWQQRSDLVHEMIHGRIGQAQQRTRDMTEKIEYKNEEAAVNDLTKAFDDLLTDRDSLREEVRALREQIGGPPHEKKPGD